MVNRLSNIELVAKKIQKDNPGMEWQIAMGYAEKNVIISKNSQTILFINPINYSYALLDQVMSDRHAYLKNKNGKNGFATAVNQNQKALMYEEQEEDFRKSVNLFYVHPMGILYLAGVARACGFNVEILDLHKIFCEKAWNSTLRYKNVKSFFQDEINKQISAHNPKLIAVSCLFTMASDVAHDVAAVAKKIDPNQKILIGGGYPTNSTKKAIMDANIDIVIVGEGEHAFKEIICSLDEFSPETFFHNPSIVTRESLNKGIAPHGDKIQDLDNLPYPAWDLLDNPVSYIKASNRSRAYAVEEKRSITLYTSRGCPFFCTFCASHTIHGRKLRVHSLDHIFSEIDKAVKNYDVNHILIEDDIFNYNRKRTIEFSKGLIERWGDRFEIEFPNGIYIPTLDNEVVKWLNKAGMKDVHIAVESGNQYTLTNIVKKGGLTLKKIKEAVSTLNKYDILIRNFFIIGFPGETKQMMKESLQFAADLDVDWTAIFIATPIHGSDLYRMAKENGYITEDKGLGDRHVNQATLETEDFTVDELEEIHYDANLQMNFFNNRNLINKRYDRAEEIYGDVINLYPNHLFANYCYWQSLVGQGKYEKAGIIEKKLQILSKNSLNISYLKKYNLIDKEPFVNLISKEEAQSVNVDTLVAPKWQLM